MKSLIFFLLFPISSFAQGSFRLFLETQDFYKQTIVDFTDSTSNERDFCCDIRKFGIGPVDIWTTISDTAYSFNAFSQLESDFVFPLGISVNLPPDEILLNFCSIGVDWTYGREFCLRILDLQNSQLHPLPYYFTPPVLPGRFFIFVEYPLTVYVTDGCDSSLVTIDNDPFEGEYMLNSTASDLIFLPENSSNLHLPAGDWTLTMLIDDESCQEAQDFEASPVTIDASLQVPLTLLPISDPVIVPELVVSSPYDEVFWDFGDGSPFFFSDLNPVHVYSAEGNYLLRAIVRRGDCTREFTSNIVVENINSIETPLPYDRKGRMLEWGIDGRLQKRKN